MAVHRLTYKKFICRFCVPTVQMPDLISYYKARSQDNATALSCFFSVMFIVQRKLDLLKRCLHIQRTKQIVSTVKINRDKCSRV